MKQVLPVWSDITWQMQEDPEAIEKFGWVRDMYSFSIAVAKCNISMIIKPVPYNKLMVQPPADKTVSIFTFLRMILVEDFLILQIRLWNFTREIQAH